MERRNQGKVKIGHVIKKPPPTKGNFAFSSPIFHLDLFHPILVLLFHPIFHPFFDLTFLLIFDLIFGILI